MDRHVWIESTEMGNAALEPARHSAIAGTLGDDGSATPTAIADSSHTNLPFPHMQLDSGRFSM
jgi:hypothetical protein